MIVSKRDKIKKIDNHLIRFHLLFVFVIVLYKTTQSVDIKKETLDGILFFVGTAELVCRFMLSVRESIYTVVFCVKKQPVQTFLINVFLLTYVLIANNQVVAYFYHSIISGNDKYFYVMTLGSTIYCSYFFSLTIIRDMINARTNQ